MNSWKQKIGKAKRIAVRAKILHYLVHNYKTVQDGVEFSIRLFALDYWVRRLVEFKAALYFMAADLYDRHHLVHIEYYV
jgi:hypothetical protein